jgi:hypothetical protein
MGANDRFLENTPQLNTAAYYYDYENKEAQVSHDRRVSGNVVLLNLVIFLNLRLM